MAGYGYMNRGYIAQEKSRAGTTSQPWGSSYNRVEARSDQWSKAGFVTNGEGYHDYRYSPDSIDAEGWTNTIVACTPDENMQYFVTRRETIVEQVHAPLLTRYKDSSPTIVAPLVTRYKDSSPPRVAPLVTRYKDSSPPRVAPSVTRYKDSSPPRVAPSVTKYKDSSPTRVAPSVTRYKNSSPTRAAPSVTRYNDSSPTRIAPSVTRYKNSSPTRVEPTKDYGTINKEWSKPVNPPPERPPMVDEFITKVQTEASRPTRMGPLNGTYWRRTPNPPDHGGTNGYSDTKNNYETVPNSKQEPTMISTDGWTRPSRVGWATPPSHDSALGKPTNDIGTAVEYIKEATKPPSDKTFTTERRFRVPSSPVPRVNSLTPAIDAIEAARRYNGTMLKADP